MGLEEFIPQFPKEAERIEALGYKITSAFDGFGSNPVEIRLQKNVVNESIVREYVRRLLKEAYDDIAELVIRIRVNINANQGLTTQDVLTDLRGIKNVITVRQVGPSQSAPDRKIWLKLDLGFEDDETFDVPDLEREALRVQGVDMVRTVSYNGQPWDRS